MTDLECLYDMLEEAEALVLEPRSTFDRALIGITEGGMGQDVAVYDVALCVKALQDTSDMDEDEAMEFFQFNTLGAFMGDATPVFVNTMRRNDLSA